MGSSPGGALGGLQTAGLGANPLGSTAPAYLQDLAYAQFGPNPVVSTMPTQLPQTSGQPGGGETTPLGLGGALYPQFPPGEAEALAALTSTGNGGVSPQAGAAATPFGFGPNPYASQFPSPNYLGPPLQNGGWPSFTSPAPPGATGQSSAPTTPTAPAPGFNDQQQVAQLLPLIGLESTMQQTGMGEQNLLASMLNGQGGGFGGGGYGSPWGSGGGWNGGGYGGGLNGGYGGGNANAQSASEIEQLLGPMSGLSSTDPILGSLMGTGLPSIGDLYTGGQSGIGSELGLFQDLMGIGL